MWITAEKWVNLLPICNRLHLNLLFTKPFSVARIFLNLNFRIFTFYGHDSMHDGFCSKHEPTEGAKGVTVKEAKRFADIEKLIEQLTDELNELKKAKTIQFEREETDKFLTEVYN